LAVADDDRFCESCGQRLSAERDRIEHDLAAVAGVSDVGLLHSHNEDALAMRVIGEGGDIVIAVVCDGVSTSERADKAAVLAADVVVELLATEISVGADPAVATVEAVTAAGNAVTELAGDGAGLDAGLDPDSAPACTCVCAVVTREAVTVSWLGDSRAYWLAEDGDSQQLTVDDSWATEMVAAGQWTAQQAAVDPRAHALTGWLGADADSARPHVATLRPSGHGVVLLCSDGLWNYCPAPEELAAMVITKASHPPLLAAKALVQYALLRGGHDNVTAVIAPFPTAAARRSTT
jgi:serine/threonine protein phosphatase PrpC